MHIASLSDCDQYYWYNTKRSAYPLAQIEFFFEEKEWNYSGKSDYTTIHKREENNTVYDTGKV